MKMNIKMMRSQILTVAGIALLLAAGGVPAGNVSAQAQPQSPQTPQAPQTPPGPPAVTFQVEVNFVDVDAVVTDQLGNFVGDLKKDDFELFEDGKPQKIDTFSLVEIPVERQDRFLILNRPVSSGVRTNRRPFDGRLYVIVLDDQDISPMRTGIVRRTARQFIEKYFGANDIGSVIYTSGRSDAMQDFTSDPQLLTAAIDKFVGRRLRSATLERLDQYYQRLALSSGTSSDSSDSTNSGANSQSTDPGGHSRLDPMDFERTYRALGVMGTLKNLSEYLEGVRGRRKSLMLFSEGIDYQVNDPFNNQGAPEIIRATQDAISAAARANVNFFTIDPRGLVGVTSEFMELGAITSPDGTPPPNLSGLGGIAGGPMNPVSDLMDELRLSQDSLKTLAEETGGFATVNANALEPAFSRIVDSNSRYYVMGYYPPTHPRDGRFHKIEVRVKRPGFKVAARKGYASPRGKTADERKRDEEVRRAREAKKPLADKTSTELRDVLDNPLQQSGLTLAVQAAPFRNTGTKKDASVALAIEVDGNRLAFSQLPNGLSSNQLELSLFSLTDQGKAQQGVRTTMDLTLRPETAERVKAVGVRANPRLVMAPGRYQIRVGVRETLNGQTGTVFYDLQVPDFTKEPLMMSGLLLTAASAQLMPTPQPDPGVAKLLPGPATSRREFSRNDALALLTEIYDNNSSQQPRAIDVAVRLLGEDGREVFTSRDTLNNEGAKNPKHWDAYSYAKEFPLKDVAPGRYVLRVESQTRGSDNNAKPAATETLITVR
jgi:VWFA-related protein